MHGAVKKCCDVGIVQVYVDDVWGVAVSCNVTM